MITENEYLENLFFSKSNVSVKDVFCVNVRETENGKEYKACITL